MAEFQQKLVVKYLILQHPGHNRVYYDHAGKLALAELKIAITRFSTSCFAVKMEEIEGIRYLTFSSHKELEEHDLQLLSRLSFIFALFISEKVKHTNYFRPVKIFAYEHVNGKISSLLKYHGKTNELFTKMMINVALLASDFNYSQNIQLLDPVAGKGTTLYEAAVYGFNSYGIEIDLKSVQGASLFFRKYLETERLKHHFIERQISGSNKLNATKISDFEYAHSKEEFKNPELRKKLGIICGSNQHVFNYFKKEKFHLVVGDLPYGIVHGHSSQKKTKSLSRNPAGFLKEWLPEWFKVIKKGGVVVLAWNSFLATRQKLATIFSESGFNVLLQSPFDEFEHMVDKSIKRDIIVAKKLHKN